MEYMSMLFWVITTGTFKATYTNEINVFKLEKIITFMT